MLNSYLIEILLMNLKLKSYTIENKIIKVMKRIPAPHMSWRSWKVFPNEVHQRAKSLLRVWLAGNSRACSHGVSIASCRARLLEKSFSGV
jgi:hypothetical protein